MPLVTSGSGPVPVPRIDDHPQPRFPAFGGERPDLPVRQSDVTLDEIDVVVPQPLHDLGRLRGRDERLGERRPDGLAAVDHRPRAIDPRSAQPACRNLLLDLRDVRHRVAGVEDRGHAGVQERVEVALIIQVVGRQAVPAALQVRMQIGEAWHQRPAGPVDHLGARGHRHLRARTGGPDALAFDDNRGVGNRGRAGSVDERHPHESQGARGRGLWRRRGAVEAGDAEDAEDRGERQGLTGH